MTDGLPNAADERVTNLLRELGVSKDFRIAEAFVSEVIGLIGDEPSTLDLKIASASVTEMRDAFDMFEPYRDVPKVTIFGSARTRKDDPLYEQTRRVAHQLAEAGWMVVTGAGPGIMEAGMEGAGRERSIGVSIRLPFETGANSVIAGDAKHVSMKYFFTRKLMLVKESAAFVCMPGGFGTLDETFELLTLTQTGKGLPVPIVFLDTPGDPYWEAVDAFVSDASRGARPGVRGRPVAVPDHRLGRRGRRRDPALLRELPQHPDRRRRPRRADAAGPDRRSQLADLNERFAHLATDGAIQRVEPYGVERRQDDHVELPRIAFVFDHHGYAELRGLIDAINTYV